MTRTIKASDAKTRFFELLKGVQTREDEVIVTKDGEPAAVLMNYREFESLIETLEILSDPKAMQRLRNSEQYIRKGGRLFTHEEVFGSSE